MRTVGAFIGTYTFPNIIDSLGGSGTYGGDTVSVLVIGFSAMAPEMLNSQGVFWIGSGLAIVSAIITFVFIPNIKPDEMHKEDLAVSLGCQSVADMAVLTDRNSSGSISRRTDLIPPGNAAFGIHCPQCHTATS